MTLFRFDPDFRRPNISPQQLVENLRAWKARTGWSSTQIAKGLEIECGPNARSSSTTINDWLRGRAAPRRDLFRYFREFMERHPNAAPYSEWEAARGGRPTYDIYAEEKAIAGMRDQVERDRAAYVRKCLEAERKPQRSATPRGVIYPAWARKMGSNGDHHA